MTAAAPAATAAPDKVANPDHYTAFAIQPLEYAMKNKLPFAEANIIKYVSRWRGKNGVEDLKKARSMLDKLIAFEETGSIHGKAPAQAELPLVGHAEEASLSAAGLTKGGSKGKTEHQVQCVACLGSGRHYPDCSGAPDDCPVCSGTGKHDEAIAVPQHSGLVSEKAPRCEVCRGYGSNDHLKLEPCYRCKGAGVSPKLVVRSISADTDTVIKVREFIEACVACAKHTGTTIGDPAPFQSDCFHQRAAAYNALPAFLKD